MQVSTTAYMYLPNADEIKQSQNKWHLDNLSAGQAPCSAIIYARHQANSLIGQ